LSPRGLFHLGGGERTVENRHTQYRSRQNVIPERMPTVILGRSGLEVSVIGWGAPGSTGKPEDMGSNSKSSRSIWTTFQSRGGNFLDTAPSYWDSEALIGQHVSRHRNDFVLATKSHPVDAVKTLDEVETSLERMKTDVIDLFYAPHGCSTEEQLYNSLKKGGVMEGAVKAKERGLVKHIAFSFDYFQKLDIHRLRELIRTGVYEVVQLPCCLVRVEPIEKEIIPLAKEEGMGVVANFPTMNALTAREWGVFYSVFEGIVDTPGQASLLAVLCHPDIDCVLVRFSSPARVEENCFAGRRFAAMDIDEKLELRRRVEAMGQVRFLERGECPPAPEGVNFRQAMIYFDLFTRFGFSGARPTVENFLRRVREHPDFEWDDTARAAIEEVQRACPVLLT